MKLLQIDEDVFRQWLMLYFDRMKEMEAQVLTYRTTVEILKRQIDDGNQAQLIDRLVDGIQNGKDVKEVLDEKYARYREKALEAIAQGSQSQALSRYLQEWRAKGPIN
jgi:type II secretory pathway component PulF